MRAKNAHLFNARAVASMAGAPRRPDVWGADADRPGAPPEWSAMLVAIDAASAGRVIGVASPACRLVMHNQRNRSRGRRRRARRRISKLVVHTLVGERERPGPREHRLVVQEGTHVPRLVRSIITTDAQMNRRRRGHEQVAGPRLLAHVLCCDQQPSPPTRYCGAAPHPTRRPFSVMSRGSPRPPYDPTRRLFSPITKMIWTRAAVELNDHPKTSETHDNSTTPSLVS